MAQSSLAKDLENWMTKLPSTLKDRPIIQLAIPGSHDSITYNITKKSEITREFKETLGLAGIFDLRGMISKFAKTQGANVIEQLRHGIRYFDFRIYLKNGNFFFVHSLISDPVETVLKEINGFLNKHPGECQVVILDCQNLLGFKDDKDEEHERLIRIFVAVFGTKIAPYLGQIKSLTLQSMAEKNYQVLIIYRVASAKKSYHKMVWPGQDFQKFWPQTDKTKDLIRYLSSEEVIRKSEVGGIYQCVLTPPDDFQWSYLCGSLKTNYFKPLENKKYKWLSTQEPGMLGVNVVISDFIENSDYKFPKTVIRLNEKLL